MRSKGKPRADQSRQKQRNTDPIRGEVQGEGDEIDPEVAEREIARGHPRRKSSLRRQETGAKREVREKGKRDRQGIRRRGSGQDQTPKRGQKEERGPGLSESTKAKARRKGSFISVNEADRTQRQARCDRLGDRRQEEEGIWTFVIPPGRHWSRRLGCRRGPGDIMAGLAGLVKGVHVRSRNDIELEIDQVRAQKQFSGGPHNQ